MKNYTLIASPLNEEGLWLAEILEVKGCKTQGMDLLEVIQKVEELRAAIETINGLQYIEDEQIEDEQKESGSEVIGYFLSHKNKTNGSICSSISEVLEVIEDFDIIEDRGDKAFRRHLGIMLTHLSLEFSTLSIGPWTIQCKPITKQLESAPKWSGWKDKWTGNAETA